MLVVLSIIRQIKRTGYEPCERLRIGSTTHVICARVPHLLALYSCAHSTFVCPRLDSGIAKVQQSNR